MSLSFLSGIIILTLLTVLLPQAYARKIYIRESQTIIRKTDITPTVGAGDTLVFKEGKRDWLLFENIQGLPGRPVVVMNEGGIVEISGANIKNHAVRFNSCNYIKLTGCGVEGVKYGIHISYSQQGTHGISIENLSDHFEVEFVEISRVGFAGIMAKSDNAGKEWVMKNMFFHDNYIHDTAEGEGLYIGHSYWTLHNMQHNIDSLAIYRNHIVNTAAEGIQVGCTYEGNADVYDNLIINYGKTSATFASNQGNGIQLGNGFSGRVYNNIIQAGSDSLSQNGMNILGVGNIYIYRNLIISPGELGIYSGYQSAELTKSFYFINNIIVKPGKEAIQYDPRINLRSYFYKNILVNPTALKIADIRSGRLDTLQTRVYYHPADLKKIIRKNYKESKLTLKDEKLISEIKKMNATSMNEKLYLRPEVAENRNLLKEDH